MEKLKYLLISDKDNRQARTIEQALLDRCCDRLDKLFTDSAMDKHVARICPDVLIVVTEHLKPSALESIRNINDHHPIPVVIFAEQQKHRSHIANAINSGVSAYIVDGLQTARVYTIVEIAIARFEYNQSLHHELEQTKTKLRERKLVDRAKGILMDKKGISEEDAYQTLRKLAMDRNTPLPEMAQNLISMAEILTPG